MAGKVVRDDAGKKGKTQVMLNLEAKVKTVNFFLKQKNHSGVLIGGNETMFYKLKIP